MAGPRVFVSHSHYDSAFTTRLVADLQAAGADVWVDVVGIDRGDFQERINEALGACQYFVLVLTPQALAAPWVRMETNAAIKRKMEGKLRDVLPVVAQPVDPSTIPPTWDTFQRFDATRDYATAFAGIARALGLYAAPAQGMLPYVQPYATPAQHAPMPSYPVSGALITPQVPPVIAQTPAQAAKARPRKHSTLRIVLLIVGILATLFIVGNLIIAGILALGVKSFTDREIAAATEVVNNFCAYYEEQSYFSAWVDLSPAMQGHYRDESAFEAQMKTLDQKNGRVTTCEIDPKHPVTLNTQDSGVTATIHVVRGSGAGTTGEMTLIAPYSGDINDWLVDSVDDKLDLI